MDNGNPQTALATSEQTLSIEQIIVEAVRAGTPVETMERLLAMRNTLKAERAQEAFFAALSAFQAECPVIQKTKKVLNKDGKSVRYLYAPLDSIVEQVKALLEKNGFSYALDSVVEPGWVTAVCRTIHREGHSETSTFKVPVNADSYMNEAQKVASALTFCSRYAFRNAFGILTGDEDDDAQAVPETFRELVMRRLHVLGSHEVLHAHAGLLKLASLTDMSDEHLAQLERHLQKASQLSDEQRAKCVACCPPAAAASVPAAAPAATSMDGWTLAQCHDALGAFSVAEHQEALEELRIDEGEVWDLSLPTIRSVVAYLRLHCGPPAPDDQSAQRGE